MDTVLLEAAANLPTRYGTFTLVAFTSADGKEHAALVRGVVDGCAKVPVRLHSECLSGDAFASLRCDCREQLERSMETLGNEERGILLYLRQEGRGIGFANKVKAYRLQELGLDTNQANEALGFRVDERAYGVAAAMLKQLGVQSIQLFSNNPTKIADLSLHGIKVENRIPLQVVANPHNRAYLETKRTSGHLLDAPRMVPPATARCRPRARAQR